MKRFLICIAILTVTVAALAWARLQESTPRGRQILGVWQLVSADYNGQPSAAGTTQVKMISDKRFMWIQYDSAKNKTLESGFGTYVFMGDSYTEHIELLDVSNAQGNSYVRKDLTFTVKIEGDTLMQTGSIGDLKLKETWKRIDH